MKTFDSIGNLKFILEEIKKTDTLYNRFKKEFTELVYADIQEYYPDTRSSEEIDVLIEAYAVALLNGTESVIDKDRNYPMYRLEEELDTMNQLTLKLSNIKENDAFREAIHLKAKELMVKYFASVYDLSSTGFRLLEKNAKLYNWEFASNFESTIAAR